VNVDDRLAELDVSLPQTVTPVANYVLARRSGDLLFVSGHVGKSDGQVIAGRVGDTIDRDAAHALARAAAIDMLASTRSALGSLDKVRGVIKVVGFVNCTPEFTDQSSVVNGASDLLVDVFGPERGRHARSAVGVAALPLGAAVEIEAVFEVG
jgi:enamine deaminase RidA (YjgF/YER057c/UK114 family)